MTVAKGRTDCEAERETIVQGFNELLKVLKETKSQKEAFVKASLYDIISEKSLSDEERLAQTRPLNDELSQQEESDIRIRRSILIGLFSFWELSLKEICNYYKIDVAYYKGTKQKKDSSKADKIKYSENDYLKAIFHSERPNNVGMISTEIKELRNYMTHGSADKDRQEVIDALILSHPEFCVSKICNSYHITSYEGLEKILTTIKEGLSCAEMVAKNKH